MLEQFPDADIVFVESGGDNLAATFSPELSDLTLYVIDVAAGEKIPRKGGPGITKSDLLVINRPASPPPCGSEPGRDGRRHMAHAHQRPGAEAICHDQPQDLEWFERSGGLYREARHAAGLVADLVYRLGAEKIAAILYYAGLKRHAFAGRQGGHIFHLLVAADLALFVTQTDPNA